MSDATYDVDALPGREKPVVWLHGRVESPPFSHRARVMIGELLKRVQRGDKLPLPHCRPMPTIGRRCHELRVRDEDREWRLFYFAGEKAIVVLDVVLKKTPCTPRRVVEGCRRRLGIYMVSEQGGDTP
ncbi:MAG: type II toxin-antitoxin system RelE/ParE family toxin [Candidatus Eisenbacteria bacterium]|nr:type II toxin-antitoxin system RelE/ParE family toxin [Candidatus Eisenbacteria bacterium]